MNPETLLLYLGVSVFYVISPGPAIFLSISNGMSANMGAVMASSLGNIIGLLLVSVVSILGLGAVLAASASLFLLLKAVGAAYLIYLGIRQLRRARSKSPAFDTELSANAKRRGGYLYEGFLIAATNPKAILFFTALFPQFLDLNRAVLPQFVIMTGAFMLLSFISLCSYGFVSKSARHLFADQGKMLWFHRVTGGLFIGMGLGLLQLRHSQ